MKRLQPLTRHTMKYTIGTKADKKDVIVSYDLEEILEDTYLRDELIRRGVIQTTYRGAQKRHLIAKQREGTNEFKLEDIFFLSTPRSAGVSVESVKAAMELLTLAGFRPKFKDGDGSIAKQAKAIKLTKKALELLAKACKKWEAPACLSDPKTLADAAKLSRWKKDKDKSEAQRELLADDEDDDAATAE